MNGSPEYQAEAAIVNNIYVPNEPGLLEPFIPAEDETPTYYAVI